MPTEAALNALLAAAITQFRNERDVAAIEVFNRYLTHRDEDMEARYFFGECLRRIGRRADAEAEFIRVLKSDSSYSDRRIHIRLAQLYQDWGKHELAETYWAEACKSKAVHGWEWIMRGANLANWGRFDEAARCQRNALEIGDCDRDEAFLNLGFVKRATGDYVGAENAFREALAITPEYPHAIEALETLQGVRDAIDETNRLLST
jgi:tetratricopeptide (TPR) repeat protein